MYKQPDNVPQPLRPFLLTIGTILICTGAVMGLFFVYIVYQILTNPEDVKLIAYINEYVGKDGQGLGDKILSGLVDGQNIDINVSDTGIMISFVFILLLALGAFSTLARMLVEGGSAIFKIYTRPLRYEVQEKVKRKQDIAAVMTVMLESDVSAFVILKHVQDDVANPQKSLLKSQKAFELFECIR